MNITLTWPGHFIPCTKRKDVERSELGALFASERSSIDSLSLSTWAHYSSNRPQSTVLYLPFTGQLHQMQTARN